MSSPPAPKWITGQQETGTPNTGGQRGFVVAAPPHACPVPSRADRRRTVRYAGAVQISRRHPPPRQGWEDLGDDEATRPRLGERAGTAMSALRIVLADDDVLLREGLACLLERSGLRVLGQAGDAGGLLDLVRDTRPDVAVVDIRMPPTWTTEGLRAAQVIRQEFPDIGILVLSAHVELTYTRELLASGRGLGYLLKAQLTDVLELLDTLDRVAKGATVVDPKVVYELVSARQRKDPLTALSSREREVLALIAEGRSNAGIARRLSVAEATIEKHVRSIMAKLDLPETEEDHRRVLAALAFLDSR
jgi:DNA-binding NarL/FixJ family response regulator